MAKIGIYCINKYRTGEYQADMIAKILSKHHTTTRLVGTTVDFMIVINGVYKADTMNYTNSILNKMKVTPNLFLINEKRAEVPKEAGRIYSQYVDSEHEYFQLSSVALFDERFDKVEDNYLEDKKKYNFIYWGHKKEGRSHYEDKYCKYNNHSLLIGEWGKGNGYYSYVPNLPVLHSVISEGATTIIFGDSHDNENNMPLRVYEALMCGVTPFFDNDFIHDSTFSVNNYEEIPIGTKTIFSNFIKWFLPMGIDTHREDVRNKLEQMVISTRYKKSHKTTDEVILDRANMYGSYQDGVVARAEIMESIDKLYLLRHNKPMDFQAKAMYSDIVLKIMRSIQNPQDLDSWTDLEGYARLVKKVMIEKGAK